MPDSKFQVFQIATINDESVDSSRRRISVEFVESGSAQLRLNRSNLTFLVNSFGEDMKNWVGREVAVLKVTETVGGRRQSRIRLDDAGRFRWRRRMRGLLGLISKPKSTRHG